MFKYFNKLNDHQFSIFLKDCIAYKMNFRSLIWENMANYRKEKNKQKGRTQNAEPYSMKYPMEYLKWSTPKNHVLVK